MVEAMIDRSRPVAEVDSQLRSRLDKRQHLKATRILIDHTLMTATPQKLSDPGEKLV